ncbi:MAG: RES domain-containing protein [Rubrobacter sp.]
MSPEPLRRPSEPGRALPAVKFHDWTDPVYRIQDAGRISSQRYPKLRYRFDAPGGEYAVLYANDTRVATFNESYAEKRRRIPAADAQRHLVRITPKRPLPLVDLRDDRTLSAMGLDARISVGDDYEACRQWALAFHEEWPEVCGIAYAARWCGVRTTNVALFVERCREDLVVDSLGRLGDPALEDLVLEDADRYKLRVAFLA